MSKLASSNVQLWYHSVRYTFSPKNYADGQDITECLEDFKTKEFSNVAEALKAVMGPKGHYIFQLECSVVEELGDVKGHENWHFQGFLKTTDKVRSRTLGSTLGKTLPGVYVCACSTEGIESLKSYVMKKDHTFRAGPWADKTISFAPEEYKGEDLPEVLRPWQLTIVNEVKVKCTNDRVINWIYDEKGEMGKSKLCKYLEHHNLAETLSFDSASNLKYQVVKAGIKKAYFFDLPRTKSKHVSMDEIYEALEAIKNGLVKSGKYEGGRLLMASPHVWVMSNYPCAMHKMSQGRFKCWYIDPTSFSLVESASVPPV